jgi:uncharacterized protein (UPF0548 family)
MSRVQVLRAGSLPVVDDLTYPEHGATAGSLPAGYHHLERQARLGSGREVFERAAAALMSWRVHRAAGLKVLADGDARPGLRVVSRLALGLTAPCQVVYVIDEPGRRGFAYGTLRGHPECGEESFVVTIGKDGEVLFTVRAFARPGTLLARATGPAGRVAQRLVTERYVRGMRRLAAGSR